MILHFCDNTQKDLSNDSVDWASSSPSTINISSDGTLAVYKAGTVTISASYHSLRYFGDGVYANPITVTVSGRALKSINVNLSNGNIAK